MLDGSIISRLLRPFASKPQPCTSIVFCIDPLPCYRVAGHTTERIFHSIFNFQSYRKTRRGQDYQVIQRRRCYTFSPDAGGS